MPPRSLHRAWPYSFLKHGRWIDSWGPKPHDDGYKMPENMQDRCSAKWPDYFEIPDGLQAAERDGQPEGEAKPDQSGGEQTNVSENFTARGICAADLPIGPRQKAVVPSHRDKGHEDDNANRTKERLSQHLYNLSERREGWQGTARRQGCARNSCRTMLSQ